MEFQEFHEPNTNSNPGAEKGVRAGRDKAGNEAVAGSG
jgi:hypothetical protein